MLNIISVLLLIAAVVFGIFSKKIDRRYNAGGQMSKVIRTFSRGVAAVSLIILATAFFR